MRINGSNFVALCAALTDAELILLGILFEERSVHLQQFIKSKTTTALVHECCVHECCVHPWPTMTLMCVMYNKLVFKFVFIVKSAVQ